MMQDSAITINVVRRLNGRMFTSPVGDHRCSRNEHRRNCYSIHNSPSQSIGLDPVTTQGRDSFRRQSVFSQREEHQASR
jgi:hypothetical protein